MLASSVPHLHRCAAAVCNSWEFRQHAICGSRCWQAWYHTCTVGPQHIGLTTAFFPGWRHDGHRPPAVGGPMACRQFVIHGSICWEARYNTCTVMPRNISGRRAADLRRHSHGMLVNCYGGMMATGRQQWGFWVAGAFKLWGRLDRSAARSHGESRYSVSVGMPPA
jgi:hypothetical protein